MMRLIPFLFEKYVKPNEDGIEAQKEKASSKKRNVKILLIVIFAPIAAQIGLLWLANKAGEKSGGLVILLLGFLVGNAIILFGGPYYIRNLNRSNQTDAKGKQQTSPTTSANLDPKKLHLLDLSRNKE